MDIVDLIDKGKVKRFFQVRDRLIFEGAVCHITQRAPGKEPLFVEKNDYLYMLHLIKENSKKFNYEIFAFTLMLNHLHLLIRLRKVNLSEAMKVLFETYARYFNKKYERKGPVFCKPYRGALCFDDVYLLAASIYIHLNPVKAGLVERPSEYRWSSYLPYGGKKEVKTFLNYRFILKMLDNDLEEARKYYRELIAAAMQIRMKNVLEDPKGMETFKNNFFRFLKKIVPDKNMEGVSKIDALNNEALEMKINELNKKKRLRQPQEMKARKFLIEQLISRGYKVKEIAQKLNISRVSVYKTAKLTF